MSVPTTESQRQLRAIGEAVLRLAEGELIQRTWLDEQFSAAGASRDVLGKAELLTVAEACERLRISKWSFYELMHRNEIATVTIGRRRLVPRSEVERFVRELAGVGGVR